jgi:hypothetical protein
MGGTISGRIEKRKRLRTTWVKERTVTVTTITQLHNGYHWVLLTAALNMYKRNCMKALFLSLALLSVIIMSAQETKYGRDYYLVKAKHQKTVGDILATTGVVLFISGLLVGPGEQSSGWGFSSNFGTVVLLVGGGMVCGLSCIPFYVSSRANSKKAASVNLTIQRILMPQSDAPDLKIQPSISLKLAL